MAIGYISHINNKEHYGFIDSPELQLEDIFFHTSYCEKRYSFVYKGDKVNFDLETNSDNRKEAKNISFIQNANLDSLKLDYENNTILKGFLKKIDDKYYVKDKETYVLIQLIVVNYEINIDEVYEKNLNKMIDYKIISISNNNKIRAININRQFSPESNFKIEGIKTEGVVVATIKYGYQIKIYDNILGFLPNTLVIKSKVVLEVGDLIKVTCIEASEDLSNVIFDLTENVDNETNLQIEQEIFVSSLKRGDGFLGIIKRAQGFGVFVSFGLSEGLLHINDILGENYNLSKPSKKEFSKIIEKIFLKGIEIDITIDEITDGRIKLTWDFTLERNKSIHQEIYSKYIRLKTS